MTEYEDPQLTFNVVLSGEEDQSHYCVVTVSTLDDSATRKSSSMNLTGWFPIYIKVELIPQQALRQGGFEGVRGGSSEPPF